ncbi:nicotinate-nucleotide--dimethylbenzimidazole phosphoribosyltransferase [Kitasatospora sp. NPDC092286]|uniref:nicotinate-nucleotide--dimethylbenzimidazole phosphoribosyltransferase n=1 Tax=Kitasatospora sp. NPDC092286 TaxID=3364087 RepID=UPI00382B44B9
MTDGGHVPNEGLPEHLLAGPAPLGGPEGVAVPVAPVQGVAMDGGAVPNPAVPGAGGIPPQGVHGQGLPQGVPGHGTPAVGVPGGGWAVDPGAPRPAFHFLDQPDQPDPLDDEDDVLLMPGPQGSWGEPPVPADQLAYGAEEQTGAAVPGTPVEPSWPPLDPPLLGAADPAALHAQAQSYVQAQPQTQTQGQPVQAQGQPHGQPPVQAQGPEPLTVAQAPRRPLHAGPPIPDPSLMTGHVPVRSLADRGPSQGATPAHGIPVVVGPQPEPQAAVPAQGFAPQAAPAGSAQPGVPVQNVQQVPEAEPAAPVAPQAAVAAPVADATAQPVAEPTAEPVTEPVTEAPAVAQDTAEAPAAEQVPAPGAAEAGAATVPAEQAVPAVAAEEQPAPAGQPRRISAFLAAPTPHGLPQVEAVEPAPVVAETTAQQPAPIAVAEQGDAPAAEVAHPAEVAQHAASAQAATEPEQAAPADTATEAQPAAPAPEAVEAGETAETVETTETAVAAETQQAAETAAGTGEMPSGQAVVAPSAEQPQEATPVEAGPAEPATAEVPPAAEPAVTEPAAETEAEAVAEAEPAVAQDTAEEPAPGQDAAEEPVAETAPEAGPQPEAGPGAEPAAAPDTAAAQDATEDPAPGQDPAPDPVAEPAAEEPAAEEPVTAEPVAEEPAPEEPAEPRGPAAPGYDEAGREAVHQVIRERRDVRNGFRPDPIPHEVLIRVLEAAHTAPSVGYSQPWDFVVIRSAKTRRKMHELAERQREAYADSLPKGRAKQFKEIKIEAILETPVNIVVTADRTRGGRHTLGRHTQPQMAPYSAALAVENLWLAARAEGLGVGWVSFFDEDEMVRELGLPEHLEVVAYLCVGYVDAFPDEPELQQQGWARKRPLSWVVHEEQYGNRALPGEEPHGLLSETLRGIRPLDAKALGESWDRQKRMTKPAGSLGMLEIISAQLSGLSRKCPPPVPEPACVAIFAGDHGVHAQGVSPWPQEVTVQMVGNFLAGGAVINSFAKQIGTEVCVVDVGVAAELPDAVQQGRTTGLLPRKVRPGTDDMTQGPAMSREEALKAIEVGIETARDLVAAGNKALVTGDMGIANTTASAALISVFTGLDPAEVTGRGTGIDDETHARKVEVVRAALALHEPDPADPIGVLAAVGGLEHAAIAGFLLGAASLRTPVVLDGVIAGSAALVAKAIAPEVLAACIAGHRSAEPGHQAALAKLGLRPLIDLDLRLGEGTGALLALPLVQSAARAMHDVATFDSAGVTEKA